jgi:hypothetical protein
MHKFINQFFERYTVGKGSQMESARTVEGQVNSSNEKMVRFVRLLEEVGPDIAEISRRMGEYKETVRYWYKEKILGKGFAIRATPDITALGLKRVMMITEFSSQYHQLANPILMAMNQLCYVTYFGKTIPGRKYIVDATVPKTILYEYIDFIRELTSIGLFSSTTPYVFDWVRNTPMKAEFYDFDTGIWDFDWSRPRIHNISGYEVSSEAYFDYVDLLIVKELQMDADTPLAEMANKFGKNYKTVYWHYMNHVKGKLIKSYWLNWLGTRYDYDADRALHRKHRYLMLSLLVKNITKQENSDLSSKLNMLPFLYFEEGGDHYFADFAFPVDFVNEAYAFLDEVLEPYSGRFEIFSLDSTNAMAFTLPYEMYNPEIQQWLFNKDELLNRFTNLIMKIKEVRWDQ